MGQVLIGASAVVLAVQCWSGLPACMHADGDTGAHLDDVQHSQGLPLAAGQQRQRDQLRLREPAVREDAAVVAAQGRQQRAAPVLLRILLP